MSPTKNVIGLREPSQRNGPAVQTNFLVKKRKGIVTMIPIVRENFNVATTIAVPDLITAQIVALIRRIVIGKVVVHGAVVLQIIHAKKEMGIVTMTVNAKATLYVA